MSKYTYQTEGYNKRLFFQYIPVSNKGLVPSVTSEVNKGPSHCQRKYTHFDTLLICRLVLRQFFLFMYVFIFVYLVNMQNGPQLNVLIYFLIVVVGCFLSLRYKEWYKVGGQKIYIHHKQTCVSQLPSRHAPSPVIYIILIQLQCTMISV